MAVRMRNREFAALGTMPEGPTTPRLATHQEI